MSENPSTEKPKIPLPFKPVKAELEARVQVAGMLDNLRRRGFTPSTIVDVGANRGNWTIAAKSVYPDAHYHLFEANPDHFDTLRATVHHLGLSPSSAEVHSVALGSGFIEGALFHRIKNDITSAGSSFYPEATHFEKETIPLRIYPLDFFSIKGSPILVKLDTQGSELDILKGAQGTLIDTEVVISEVSLLPYNRGAPLFAEVVAYMHSIGFHVYDLGDKFHRYADGAPFQVDVIFVRSGSQLRAPRRFW